MTTYRNAISGPKFLINFVATHMLKNPGAIGPYSEGQVIRSSQSTWRLKMGRIGFTETSENNYQCTLRNIRGKQKASTIRMRWKPEILQTVDYTKNEYN